MLPYVCSYNDLMPTCHRCAAAFPNHVTVSGKTRNLQNRKFCLICSPFGRHNTSKQPGNNSAEQRRCPRCEQTHHIDQFYRRRDGKNYNTYCKACTAELVTMRQQSLKRLAVAYKGGCCELCGYDRYIGSLEFHHTDPDAKEFDLGYFRSTDFEKARPELDKCRLLCANCHREEHARLRGLLDW